MAPSTTIYSDRFIPSRSGSNFSLYDALHSNSSSSSPSSFNGFSGGAEGSSSGAYSTLLREVLLGQPATGNLNTNILRFKAENQWSPHVEFDGVLPKGIFVAPKTSRGFPKSPYKVIMVVVISGELLWIGLDFFSFSGVALFNRFYTIHIWVAAKVYVLALKRSQRW